MSQLLLNLDVDECAAPNVIARCAILTKEQFPCVDLMLNYKGREIRVNIHTTSQDIIQRIKIIDMGI